MINVLLSVLALILLDTLLGIILSIKAGTFNVRKLPQFLVTNLLPIVGSLLVLVGTSYVAGQYTAEVTALFYAAAAAAALKFIAEIKDKVMQVFGMMDIPDSTTNKVTIQSPLDINTVIDKIVDAMKKATTS